MGGKAFTVDGGVGGVGLGLPPIADTVNPATGDGETVWSRSNQIKTQCIPSKTPFETGSKQCSTCNALALCVCHVIVSDLPPFSHTWQA
jgi:hypothetical protein